MMRGTKKTIFILMISSIILLHCGCNSSRDTTYSQVTLTPVITEISSPNDIETAIDILNDPKSTNQQLVEAAFSLESHGIESAPATASLTHALQHQNTDVRWAAARALGAIGVNASEALPDLIDLMEHGTTFDEQATAAIAISQIVSEDSDSSLLPYFVEALKHDSSIIRGAMVEAIGKMRYQARSRIPLLASLLWDDEEQLVRGKAAYAIQVITRTQFSNIPDEPYWENGFKIDLEENELEIVLTAREWWLSEGQNENWK